MHALWNLKIQWDFEYLKGFPKKDILLKEIWATLIRKPRAFNLIETIQSRRSLRFHFKVMKDFYLSLHVGLQKPPIIHKIGLRNVRRMNSELKNREILVHNER